jgi:hypothetical protein
MDIVRDSDRIVCERGIEFCRAADDLWYCRSKEVDTPVNSSEIISALGVRIILVRVRVTKDHAIESLVPAREKRLLNVELSELCQALLKKQVSFLQGSNLVYVTGAVCHHCQQLCEVYSKMNYEHLSVLSEHSLYGGPERWIASDQPEAYYEFDALISAARRAYEAVKFILWSSFGAKHDTPANFKTTLAKCDNAPVALRERLELSWETFGSKLKDYRDCIHHYVPLSKGTPHARIDRLHDGIWAATFLIPDNPEAKSQRLFTFDLQLDALTYGWKLADEIIEVAKAVVIELPEREKVS